MRDPRGQLPSTLTGFAWRVSRLQLEEEGEWLVCVGLKNVSLYVEMLLRPKVAAEMAAALVVESDAARRGHP